VSLRHFVRSVVVTALLPWILSAANQRVLEASKSVVQIVNFMRNGEGAGGSAFCVDESGYFLTNAHVVAESRRLGAVTPRGLVPARLVLFKPEVDLAVLKIEGLGMKALAFAKKRDIQVTDRVISIGFPGTTQEEIQKNPTAMSSVTFNAGIIGKFTKIDLSILSGNNPEPVVQHDAAVNHGNSGGPLVNECGHVVGINVQKGMRLPHSIGQIITGDVVQGIYYAIDISLAEKVLMEAGVTYLEGNADCSGTKPVGAMAPVESNRSAPPTAAQPSGAFPDKTVQPGNEVIFAYIALLLLIIVAIWALAYHWSQGRRERRDAESDRPTIDRIPAPAGGTPVEAIVLQPRAQGSGLPVIVPGATAQVVGRSRSAEIRIDHPLVSARHLSICLRPDGRPEVTDLGSTNGTFINGRRLKPGFAEPLQPGDLLTIGTGQVAYQF